MHKFFCNFNELTQKYELSQNKNSFISIFNNVDNQAQNTLLTEIKSLLQELYQLIILVKEKETADNRLSILDETELLISNLYYSLFASPLELPPQNLTISGNELPKALQIVGNLEKLINIPEYIRLASIIINNISFLL